MALEALVENGHAQEDGDHNGEGTGFDRLAKDLEMGERTTF